MPSTRRRWFIGFALVGALIMGMIFAWLYMRHTVRDVPVEQPVIEQPTPTEEWAKHENIGLSVEGRNIEAYTYGTGTKEIIFVGGVHGGYEWNSVLLAYQVIDYIALHPDLIPSGLRVTVISSLNPDGVFAVVQKEGRFTTEDARATSTASGLGRLNAHRVDLNRNFDCKWQPNATWRSVSVSAGTEPFSEPEALAFKKYVETHQPVAVVLWHSKSNAVYASECENGILPGTYTLMNTYARAAGYPAVDSFTAYPVTGDAEGWLASIGIPAVTVELSTHETIEWEKNLEGLRAVLQLYR